MFSYWLHWGPENQTAELREDLDNDFKNLVKWLLFGGIDFDYINEALLLEIGCEEDGVMKVGNMKYDVIVVPKCETLRSNTYDFLEQFRSKGGELVIMDKAPTLENAQKSTRGEKLSLIARCIPYSRSALLEALSPVRTLDIREKSGQHTGNILHQIRQDGETRWVFLAHGTEPYNKDVIEYQDLEVTIKGTWDISVYNTLTGGIDKIHYSHKDNNTVVSTRMYSYDSLLLRLDPAVACKYNTEIPTISYKEKNSSKLVPIPKRVSFTLDEPNVLLLDQAEYALDEEMWNTQEEILRIDDLCRKRLGWPSRANHVAQPWVLDVQSVTHRVHLRWMIKSEIECEDIRLAIEDLEDLTICWNGEAISNKPTGWYVDKSIQTINLPILHKGVNILEASIPFGKNTNLEWAYLLGDFGVEVSGRYTCIIAAKQELAFGSITNQGLPFYGGNITYHIPVKTKGGKLHVRSCQYRGAAQLLNLDGEKEISLVYSPYCALIEDVASGDHVINMVLYGNRRNSFGPVHLADLKNRWIGPEA